MLHTPTSLDDVVDVDGWSDVTELLTHGDFNVLDYADTPQVSPSTIVNSVIDGLDEFQNIPPSFPMCNGKVQEKVTNGFLPRHRRLSHVNAEKRRRNRIQEQLRSLCERIPSLGPVSPSKKLSELDTVVEAGKRIREWKSGSERRLSELDVLRKEKEKIKEELDRFQNALPTAGLKKEERKMTTLEDRCVQYKTTRSKENWRYSIFHWVIGENLMTSYIQHPGKQSSATGFIQSLMSWTEKNLCLIHLRPVIISGLHDVATSTNFLTDPQQLRQEITSTYTHNTTPSLAVTSCTDSLSEGLINPQKTSNSRAPATETVQSKQCDSTTNLSATSTTDCTLRVIDLSSVNFGKTQSDSTRDHTATLSVKEDWQEKNNKQTFVLLPERTYAEDTQQDTFETNKKIDVYCPKVQVTIPLKTGTPTKITSCSPVPRSRTMGDVVNVSENAEEIVRLVAAGSPPFSQATFSTSIQAVSGATSAEIMEITSCRKNN